MSYGEDDGAVADHGSTFDENGPAAAGGRLEPLDGHAKVDVATQSEVVRIRI